MRSLIQGAADDLTWAHHAGAVAPSRISNDHRRRGFDSGHRRLRRGGRGEGTADRAGVPAVRAIIIGASQSIPSIVVLDLSHAHEVTDLALAALSGIPPSLSASAD